MGTLREQWNHIQWQLDPYKWYLHSETLSSQNQCKSYQFKFLPQKYEKRYLYKIMKYLSKESTLGFLIFLVICFTLYMHTLLLDTTRSVHIPSEAKEENREKKSFMLAIVMYGPAKSLKATAASLNASQHEADVFIFRNFVGYDVYSNASQWSPNATVVLDKGRSKQTSIIKFVMDYFLSSKYDVLVTINSYSVLCVKWWNSVLAGLDKSNGVFLLYGMERNEQQMEECNDFLCHQSWFGWVGSVWRRNLATKMLSETTIEKGPFYYKVENWCKLNNIPIATLKYPTLMVLDTPNMDRRAPSVQWLQPNPLKYINIEPTNAQKYPSGKQFESVCIAAVVRVHIYREDEAKITAFEVEQWIRYMQFAGINVVYLYDAYERDDEKLYSWVRGIFDTNEVIYHDWYFNRTYDVLESVRSAYQHATKKYKYKCEWHIHADINEYPYLANDTDRDFLKRLITRVRLMSSDTNEISFPIFKFAGNETREPLVISRLQNRYKSRVYREARPLFLARFVKNTHLFHNKLSIGKTLYLDPNLARINRYILNSKDTSTVEEVIQDISMLQLHRYLKQINFISNKIPLYSTNQFWDN